MTEHEEVLIGVVEFNEGKRIKAALSERKVDVRLITNPQTCSTKGCKITVEVHARQADVPVIAEFMKEERQRLFDGLDINPELHESVFDTEKDSAKCPACGTEFSTTLKECPDCGLVFAVEEG